MVNSGQQSIVNMSQWSTNQIRPGLGRVNPTWILFQLMDPLPSAQRKMSSRPLLWLGPTNRATELSKSQNKPRKQKKPNKIKINK